MVEKEEGDRARAGRDRGAAGAGKGGKETDNGATGSKNVKQTKFSHHKSNS